VGGTLEATDAALEDGIGVNLAGGTHHAFYNRPEGFCVFNDAIVAAHHAIETRGIEKVLIVDLDVHQGNGTASLASGCPSIFTFSMHGANNFPYKKEVSDLDIALLDETGNGAYLRALDVALAQISERFVPELVIYLAGADPYADDRYGHLALDKRGLYLRDERVLTWCRSQDYPVAVTMAGGYAPNVDDIVDIHLNTVSLAARTYSTPARPSAGITNTPA
jgi:acetoin utilization deacetylase AcuC-like enzyme